MTPPAPPPAPPFAKPRATRWRRVALISVGVVAGAVALAWLLGPAILQTWIERSVRDRAGIALHIESLSLLRSPMYPVRARGIVAASTDTPTSPALTVESIATTWAVGDTPRAAGGSMLPPRVVIDGLRADLQRDRSGTVNFRPRRDSIVVHESTPANGGGGARPGAGREIAWLTDLVVRKATIRAAHDSNDSKTRGAMELRLGGLRVLRHPPASPTNDVRVEQLDVALDGLEVDGPLGWGENLAVLRLPEVRASLVVPANTDDDKVRIQSLAIDGGMVRRARDHKSRWQETHMQRVAKSLGDTEPPEPDEDTDPAEPSPGSGGGASQGEIVAADPPEPETDDASKASEEERSEWPVVDRAELRNLDWIVEATSPWGFESVTYHIDEAQWIGADADEETILPVEFNISGTVGEGGRFAIEWTRVVDPATHQTTAIALSMTTRALPFHPLVWGAWKHDHPEFGEVRRALLDADYSLTWDSGAAEMHTRGTFAFREVDAVPDTRSTWQRLSDPGPSAWPTILVDLTPKGSSDAAPIVIDDRRAMPEWDAFAAWHSAQDAFVAARLEAARSLRAAGQ